MPMPHKNHVLSSMTLLFSFQEYRVEFYGSAIKADFEQHKDTD